MRTHTAFSGAFDQRSSLAKIGQRDAARELHRAEQAQRRAKKDRHEKPESWEFRAVHNRP